MALKKALAETSAPAVFRAVVALNEPNRTIVRLVYQNGIPIIFDQQEEPMEDNTLIELVGKGASSGVLATLMMDVLSFATQKSGLIRGAKGAWPGRWYLGILQGRFIHIDIDVSPPRSGELTAALAGHYTIGITLAVVYWCCCALIGYPADHILTAAGYGLATCIFPWFLMYPAFGYGMFGRNAPPNVQPLLSSTVNHLVYGLGLWWTAKVTLQMQN